MKNKIIDLFCGCGGLSLGFEQAGFEPLLAIDLWKDAIETYNFNRKNKVGKCIEIQKITDEYLEKIKDECVGVIGGPPCQGFSTVGKRQSDDPRNQLYKEYCRVVEVVNPDFFVLENVKGLLTMERGFFKDDIVSRFSSLGYVVKYKVLNASEFGIPQNRERVFFVGTKTGKFDFPKGSNCCVSCSDALSDLLKPYEDGPLTMYQKKLRGNSKVLLNNELTSHTQETISVISKIPDGGNIKSLPEDYWKIRKYNKAFERMNSSKPSNTVDTGHRNYFHYSENRIPTVRENARLQSFPDYFFFTGCKTSQYKQVGNAVPPMLAFEVAMEIKKAL